MNLFVNNKLILDNAIIIESIFRQFLGLMFSRQKNLIFKFNKEKKETIHMFFVFYPIDLIFLDIDKKVIELKENFKPFQIYNQKNKAKYMLELKKATIKQNQIKINDQISF
jgi:uncharacterized protein